MNNHRFFLQKYSSLADRFTCPSCQEMRRFTRYIDTQTGEHLSDFCGRCDRSDSCGYHYTPSDFFKENPDHKLKDFTPYAIVPAPPKPKTSYIDKAVFKQSLGMNKLNTFHSFLISSFGKEQAENLINRYHIGTTQNGGTIFYQMDLEGKVRSGKIMKYNLIDSLNTSSGKDCKRDRHIMLAWVHKALKLQDFNLSQCFFGEHLLDKAKSVCIVESEKSAVIGSIFQPEYIWIACGGKEGLGTSKIQVLKDRNIILYPDLNGFDKWSKKATEIAIIAKSVVVSPLLEGIATDAEREKGLDIADWLLRYKPSNI